MLAVTDYEAMAMLDLQNEERIILEKRINELANNFSKLEQINTTNVQPLVSVLDIKNVLREDISAKIISREEILENTPEQYDGYFQVPGTLE